MNSNLLIASLFLALPCVLSAGEADGKQAPAPNEAKKEAKKEFVCKENDPSDIHAREEEEFWRLHKKRIAKQRADAEAQRKAEEAAKKDAPAKPEEAAPLKEAKVETPPAK